MNIRLLFIFAFLCWRVTAAFAAEDVQLAPYADDTPPKIVHQPIDGPQPLEAPATIYAQVTDNSAVKNVTLFYRAKGATEYKPLEMHIYNQEKSLYSATIPAPEVKAPALEYYIQATDLHGNSMLRAGKLFPLTVSVGTTEPPPQLDQGQVQPQKQPRDDRPAQSRSYTWVWIAAGILVSAVAIAASNNDSGDGGGPTSSSKSGAPKDPGTITIIGPSPN